MKRTRVEVKESRGSGETPNLAFVITRGHDTTLVRQSFGKDGRCTDITREIRVRGGEECGAEERFDLTL